jgi:uncharacterized protein (DUF488 family)
MRCTVLHATATVARRVTAVLTAGLRRLTPNSTPVTPVLFTIGYERHAAPETLVRRLQTAGVERLVDVRDLPLSRRRGFSKSALAATLAENGLSYEHDRALGNPKPYRDLYRSGRQLEGERLYRAHIRNGSADAVDRLGETLQDHVTVVMCFEQDHKTCHRSVIVEELRARIAELRVEHL